MKRNLLTSEGCFAEALHYEEQAKLYHFTDPSRRMCLRTMQAFLDDAAILERREAQVKS